MTCSTVWQRLTRWLCHLQYDRLASQAAHKQLDEAEQRIQELGVAVEGEKLEKNLLEELLQEAQVDVTRVNESVTTLTKSSQVSHTRWMHPARPICASLRVLFWGRGGGVLLQPHALCPMPNATWTCFPHAHARKCTRRGHGAMDYLLAMPALLYVAARASPPPPRNR